MIQTNVLGLRTFKSCVKEYNPLLKKCKYCVAYDLCRTVDNYRPKLPNQKALDGEYKK